MKLATIPLVFAATAGLTSAAPIRVIFVGSDGHVGLDESLRWAQNVRWGHAAAPAIKLPPLELWAYNPTATHAAPFPTGSAVMWEPPYPTGTYRPAAYATPYPTGYPRIEYNPEYMGSYYPTGTYRPAAYATPYPTGYSRIIEYSPEYMGSYSPMPTGAFGRPAMRNGGCRGGMRATKSQELGNRLRIILGLPPISGYAVSMIDRNGEVIRQRINNPHVLSPHRHHMRPQDRHAPFMLRLSLALAFLGPWEGRAVSFVLGCGLGVLLRMLFVFGVLIVRSARARRVERRVAPEEESIIFVADVKEPVLVETLPEYAEKPKTMTEEDSH